MLRLVYLAAGLASLGLGGVGAVVPLLPTVPFLILAAFFFARSSPALERRLLEHPRFGEAIRLWRERGAISPAGKRAATLAFALTTALSFMLLQLPWSLLPLLPALIVGSWIWRRPDA